MVSKKCLLCETTITVFLKFNKNSSSQNIVWVSKLFVGLSKIEQHKLVYKSLKGKMGNELHALSITTKEK